MSSPPSDLRTRFLLLNAKFRMAIIAAGALMTYVFLDDYCWNYARVWSAEGDELQELIDRGAAQDSVMPKEVERAAIAFGTVQIPENEAKTSESLALAVTETMKKHRITLYGYEARSGGKLRSGALLAVTGTGSRIERMNGDVQFEIPADEVAQIIVDLEENPDIDSINSVKLRWLEGKKKVDVQLSAEAWALTSRDSRKKETP